MSQDLALLEMPLNTVNNSFSRVIVRINEYL